MLAREIPRYISNGNQDIAWFSRSQQEVAVMYSSSLYAKLNSASFDMIAITSSKNNSAQLMFFYTIYTNYNINR